MDYSIQIHNLVKSYGDNQALKGIDLNVEKGDIFAFLGPNGAGKSTTISILTTLLPFDHGDVKIDGYILGKQDAAIRNMMGIVFQNSQLDEILTVHQNMMTRCGLYKIHGAAARARIKELSKQCQIESYVNQTIKTLSGGQRRRVDIARALIPKPELLILDEPGVGLDPDYKKQLWSMLLKLHETYHMTIFMTTHDMDEAELANHICIINNGQIILNDKKANLLHQFQKDILYLHAQSPQQVCRILDQKHISYKKQSSRVCIEINNYYQLMSILRSCERYVHGIDLEKGSIKSMYLKAVEGEIA